HGGVQMGVRLAVALDGFGDGLADIRHAATLQLADVNATSRGAEDELRPAAVQLPAERVAGALAHHGDRKVAVHAAAARVRVEIDADVRRERDDDAAARGGEAGVAVRLPGD